MTDFESLDPDGFGNIPPDELDELLEQLNPHERREANRLLFGEKRQALTRDQMLSLTGIGCLALIWAVIQAAIGIVLMAVSLPAGVFVFLTSAVPFAFVLAYAIQGKQGDD